MNETSEEQAQDQIKTLIGQGMSRLEYRHQQAEQLAEQERVAHEQGWTRLYQACQEALPVLLQSYLAPFAHTDEGPTWWGSPWVTLHVPELAPVRVHLIRLRDEFGNLDKRYALDRGGTYSVGTPYVWHELGEEDGCICWSYQPGDIYNALELDLTLARALQQQEVARQLVVEDEQRKAAEAAQAAQAAEKTPEPEYLDMAPDPAIALDLEAITVVRRWLRKEIAQLK